LSVRSSAGPEIAMCSTSCRMTSSETIGFSVSAGKVVMPLTLLSISDSAQFVSVPWTSSMVTRQLPSTASACRRSMPAVPSIASSMRTQTASSVSSGAAPR
jgi:hypothetical protein